MSDDTKEIALSLGYSPEKAEEMQMVIDAMDRWSQGEKLLEIAEDYGLTAEQLRARMLRIDLERYRESKVLRINMLATKYERIENMSLDQYIEAVEQGKIKPSWLMPLAIKAGDKAITLRGGITERKEVKGSLNIIDFSKVVLPDELTKQ